MLIAIGLILSVIWGVTTWISLGVPSHVCHTLNRITFGFFSGAIDSMQNGFYYDVPNENMPTVIFLIFFSLAFFLYFALITFISKKPSRKKDLLKIIFFAIVFRVVFLPSIAVHENDFYRYLWDGKVSKYGNNPYKYAPGDLEFAENTFSRDYYDLDKNEYAKVKSFSVEQKQDLVELNKLRQENPVYFDRIGHRAVPTIYPPTAQLIFFISSAIREDSVLLMKFLFVLFDVMVIFVIIGLLPKVKKNPSLVIVYAWSPLILKEISNSGHYDSAAIFFMLLSIYLIIQRKKTGGVVALAFAGLTKFFPLLLTPLYIRRLKWKGLFLLGGVTAVFYIPFFLWGNTGIMQVFKGLSTYSQEWAYNKSIFIIIKSFLEVLPIDFMHGLLPAKILCAGIFLGTLLYLSLKESKHDLDLIRNSFVILALLFLLSPVGDPWYFSWVISFLCFFSYRSFLLLSWLLIFSYLSFSHDFGLIQLGAFEFPILSLIQYVPFYIYFIVEIILKRKGRANYV